MVPRGGGLLKMMKNRKGVISGVLLVRVHVTDFFRLSKMRQPGENGQPSVRSIERTHLPKPAPG